MHHHWDFFGPDAEKTAKHFEKHILEFARQENLQFDASGIFHADEHHTGYWVETSCDSDSEKIKKRLRPRRSLSAEEHHQLLSELKS